MNAPKDKFRSYDKREAVYFRTTSGEFGALSNMAPDFPIRLMGVRIPTAEALYQACRFPDLPDVQRLIIDQPSPMTAKMKSKKYRDRTRSDWDKVRANVMRWCLRAKLEHNWDRFGHILERTGQRPIVEESTKDDFWGAKPQDNGLLIGQNVLGRLLMELREEYRDAGSERAIRYPSIPHFLLFGEALERSSLERQLSDGPQESFDYGKAT
ncbi:NADAR family protein [Bradyrhizobium guangdongense]